MGRVLGLAERLWAGFSYSRKQCLANESALFDHLLKDRGLKWVAHDTPVTSKPDDVVHSVTVNGDATGGVDFVLVHGFANGGGCFFKNIAALGDMKLGRTHLVDWRGAGMSGRPRGEFPPTNEDEAIEYFVDGLEAWRRARLGADGAFVLLGHSMGGLIAAHYADRHPDRVRGLVLAGPAGVKAADPARIAAFKRRSLRHRFFWAVATVLWNAGATPQAFARALPFRWSPSAVRGYATRRWRALEFLDGDADAFDALVEYAAGVIMMRGVSERSMSLLLKPLGQARTEIGPVVERTPADLPVTFLYGAHDWMSPASGAEVVERMRANGRANVRCAILDDAGHYAFVDQPEKSHEVIEHALRKARWR